MFQSCSDSSDALELYKPQGLYLKPAAVLNISVQLPATKHPGKTISNWEVMEKLKRMIKPEEFLVLKVSKSTIEFIRFEGEIENKSKLPDLLKKIDKETLKLSGFPELLKLRAAESKVEFPTRHAWDSFFRKTKHMNEMKPGERPDTLHISNLPCKWFSDRHGGNSDKPDEYIFRKVFERFGEIRYVDIPMCDPYRSMMKAHISGVQMFSFRQDHLFEGYVQYSEYLGFVNAMDSLRGMKLLSKEGDKCFTASFKVDFDKTKHLSDTSIRRRKIERDKLMALQREQDEKERLEEELLEEQQEKERIAREEALKSKNDRRKQREEKRLKKHLKKLHAKEAEKMNQKIATEEKKLLVAQRQLESIRLLDFLFERVKEKKQKEDFKKKDNVTEKKVSKKKEKKRKKKELKTKRKKDKLHKKEKKHRSKLVKKFETDEEQEMEEQRERLRRTIEGKNKLKSVLAATCAQVSKSDAAPSAGDPVQPTVPLTGQPMLVPGNPMVPMNPAFQGAGTFPVAPQWYPPGGAYGYFDAPFLNYGYPPGFPGQRGGYFPRRARGAWGPRRPRGPRRGGGSWHQLPYANPNGSEYYNYFKRVTKDRDGHRRHSRSRSYSRSRSRSRSRRYSHSRRSRSHNSHSRRSRSRSRRSRSYSRRESRRSRSRSRRRSRSRSHSKSSEIPQGGLTRKRSRSRSRSSRSRSHSKSTEILQGGLAQRRSRSHSRRSRSRSRRPSRSRSHSKPKEVTQGGFTPRKSKVSLDKPRLRSSSKSRSPPLAKLPLLSKTSSASLSNDTPQSVSNGDIKKKKKKKMKKE